MNFDRIVQLSYLAQYTSLLDKLRVNSKTHVLDVGSGFGFLKKLVTNKEGRYVGIESDSNTINSAITLYGCDGFIYGFFPDAVPIAEYDVIVALTVLDEVPDKAKFLEGIKARLHPKHGICYLAVRNRTFFINHFKTSNTMAARSARAKMYSQDLTSTEWESLLTTAGFEICDFGKFYRPWFTGFNFFGLINLSYKLISMIIPRRYSYMLFYLIRIKK